MDNYNKLKQLMDEGELLFKDKIKQLDKVKHLDNKLVNEFKSGEFKQESIDEFKTFIDNSDFKKDLRYKNIQEFLNLLNCEEMQKDIQEEKKLYQNKIVELNNKIKSLQHDLKKYQHSLKVLDTINLMNKLIN